MFFGFLVLSFVRYSYISNELLVILENKVSIEYSCLLLLRKDLNLHGITKECRSALRYHPPGNFVMEYSKLKLMLREKGTPPLLYETYCLL